MVRAPALVILALHGCGVASHDPGPSAPEAPVASAPPPTTQLATPPTPDAWPAGFPIVSGGVPREPPPMGPVHVGLLAYAAELDATDRSYREALTSAGWTVHEETSDDRARRFVAERSAHSVSVSIYREGADTIVQTMQLDGSEEER